MTDLIKRAFSRAGGEEIEHLVINYVAPHLREIKEEFKEELKKELRAIVAEELDRFLGSKKEGGEDGAGNS